MIRARHSIEITAFDAEMCYADYTSMYYMLKRGESRYQVQSFGEVLDDNSGIEDANGTCEIDLRSLALELDDYSNFEDWFFQTDAYALTGWVFEQGEDIICAMLAGLDRIPRIHVVKSEDVLAFLRDFDDDDEFILIIDDNPRW